MKFKIVVCDAGDDGVSRTSQTSEREREKSFLAEEKAVQLEEKRMW